MFESLSPRGAAAVGLLAIAPVLVFAVGRSGLGGLISAINVVVIFAALYLALSPLDGTDGATAAEPSP